MSLSPRTFRESFVYPSRPPSALGKSSLKPEDAVADWSVLNDDEKKVLDDWVRLPERQTRWSHVLTVLCSRHAGEVFPEALQHRRTCFAVALQPPIGIDNPYTPFPRRKTHPPQSANSLWFRLTHARHRLPYRYIGIVVSAIPAEMPART